MAPKARPLPPDVASLSGETEVTIQQLSQLLGVTYQTALRYLKRGYLKGVRRGGNWIIKASEVRRFLESGNNGFNDPDLGSVSDRYKEMMARREGPIDSNS